MALVTAEVNSLNEIEAVKCPHGGRCKVCVDAWNHRCEFFSGCDQTGTGTFTLVSHMNKTRCLAGAWQQNPAILYGVVRCTGTTGFSSFVTVDSTPDNDSFGGLYLA